MFGHRHKEETKKEEDHASRSNYVCMGWTGVFSVLAVALCLAPEMALKAHGFVLDDASSEQKAIVLCLAMSLGMHFALMAGLHGAVNSNGAKETTLKSTHHLAAVRTALLTDAIWAALRCLWLWVIAAPALRHQGWNPAMIYVDSAICLAGGVMAFASSRGEEKRALGGLVKTQVNAAALKIPEFNKKNDMFLYWIGIGALGAPLLLLFPSTLLNAILGETLSGGPLACASLLLQCHAMALFNEVLTLVALASSQVLALEYAACRWLWVWGFGAAVFSFVCKVCAQQLGLASWPLFADFVGYAALSILAYDNLKDFGEKSLTETLTGRTM